MRKLGVLFAILILSCAMTRGAFAAMVLVEAESFANLGGWSVDQQMIDVIDSSVLLAHGYGRPVADATTSVTFAEPGEYRVFVRTRNWVAPWTPNEAPGTFQLLIDGKPLPTLFGTKSDSWFWEFGGNVTITSPQQRCELTLHDKTGFDGRCDAILFVRDANFTPPEDANELKTLRRKLLGLTPSPNDAPQYPRYAGTQSTVAAAPEEFDLVVCGGGIAGTCAAVAAARLGVKVALVHNRPVLGGNNSSEVRVHLQGRTHYPPYPNLGNLVYELDPLQTGNAQRGEVYRDDKKLDIVAAEPNITLLLNHHVVAVNTEKRDAKPQHITSITARNIVTNAESRLVAKTFVDATGDGTIGFLSGAAYRVGRESRSETGEPLAPEKPDALVMGASTQWYSEEVSEPTSFPKLPWAVQFTAESISPALDGEWDWETGMNRDQIGDAEAIRDHALRAVYGHWAYMKNECGGEWREKVANRQLSWVAFIAGKRESRRILGDVILQEQDIVEQRPFDDACVVTTWTIDLHYPTPHQQKYFPQEEFRTVAAHKKIVPYAIPYRCFYSRDVDNLFMAGRCISVTHVALGTIRVQRTGGMMGEVVGMAASLCREHNTTPRGVYAQYLPELIALMTTGVAPHPERYYPSAAPMLAK
ncbi:MAG: FAD-dependent oxidoreductase [Thermoguttaceae bacterium]